MPDMSSADKQMAAFMLLLFKGRHIRDLNKIKGLAKANQNEGELQSGISRVIRPAWDVCLLVFLFVLFCMVLFTVSLPYQALSKANAFIQGIDETALISLDDSGRIQGQDVLNGGNFRKELARLRQAPSPKGSRASPAARKKRALEFLRQINLPVAFVDPTATPAKLVHKELLNMGWEVVPYPCQQCLSFSWAEDGWEVSMPNPYLGQEGSSFFDNREVTLKTIRTPIVAFILNSLDLSDQYLGESGGPDQILIDEHIVLDPQSRVEVIRGSAQYVLRGIVYTMVAGAFFLTGALAGGAHGIDWNSKRNSGYLEYMAQTLHPPWVFILSSILRMVLPISILAGVALLPLAFLGPSFHWGVLLGMYLALPCLLLFSSLWGVFITVLFHHAQGRVFAKIVLSPLTLSVAWTIRVVVLWSALKATTPFIAIDTAQALTDNWAYLLLLPPSLLVMSLVLLWVINLRIGKRREGIRVLVS